MAAAGASSGRQRVYDRLVWRNRVVGVLRLLVPLSGSLALAGLSVALYLNAIGGDFSIGSVSLDRDMLVIGAPRYSGRLANGGTYDVTAETARAQVNNLDRLDVTGGTAVLRHGNARQLCLGIEVVTADG